VAPSTPLSPSKRNFQSVQLGAIWDKKKLVILCWFYVKYCISKHTTYKIYLATCPYSETPDSPTAPSPFLNRLYLPGVSTVQRRIQDFQKET